MPISQYVQNNFTGGELSPLMLGRIELPQYSSGCEIAENVLIVPQGGVRRRPGLAFVGEPSARTGDPYASGGFVVTTGDAGAVPDPSVLVDGDPLTFYDSLNDPGTSTDWTFAEIDLGVANANATFSYVDISGLSLISYPNTEDGLTGFVIEANNDPLFIGSPNFSATLPRITGESTNSIRVKVYNSGASGSLRYWRIRKTGTEDIPYNIRCGNINFLQTSAEADNSIGLKSLSVEASRNYLLEFTYDNIRVYRTDTVPAVEVANINPGDYGANGDPNLEEIRAAQLENVLLVTGNFPPKRLVNLGEDDNWVWGDIPFSTPETTTGIPQFDFNDAKSPVITTPGQFSLTISGPNLDIGDRFVIEVEGVTSRGITYSGPNATTVQNIESALQSMPVFGSDGISVTGFSNVYTVVMDGSSARQYTAITGYFTTGDGENSALVSGVIAGDTRLEDAWSSLRGWPKTIAFYENRLVLGGTDSRKQTIWFSKSGDFFNFDTSQTEDDFGIVVTISSRTLNTITDIYPGRDLQIFTAGTEFAMIVKPVTPATISIVPQTSHGSTGIEALDVDGSTMFIDRYGKSLLTYVYSFNENAYIAQDTSVLSSHLINQPVSTALLSGTRSDDANWVFILNSSGPSAVLNTLRSQEISAFTRWRCANNCSYEQAETVADNLFVLVDYDGNKTIEQWSFDRYMDSSIESQTTGWQSDQIIGLGHLIGETVRVSAKRSEDGTILNYAGGEYVISSVAGGSIRLNDEDNLELSDPVSFPSDNRVTYEVGINFVPKVKIMPISTNVGLGFTQAHDKKIIRSNLRVYESAGIYINGIEVPFRNFGDDLLSNAGTELFTGVIRDWYDSTGWEVDVAPEITGPHPLPFGIQLLEYEMQGS